MTSKKEEIRQDYESLWKCSDSREPQRLCDILRMMYGEEVTNEWTKGIILPDVAPVDCPANGKSADGERKVTEWQTREGVIEKIIKDTE